jgi:hypothetical protein
MNFSPVLHCHVIVEKEGSQQGHDKAEQEDHYLDHSQCAGFQGFQEQKHKNKSEN